MEAYDIALNLAVGNNNETTAETKLHNNIKELFAKTALLVMAAIKTREVEVYDEVLRGEKLFLLKATDFDFENRNLYEFTDSDFTILEMNEESVSAFERIAKEESDDEISVEAGKVFRGIYNKMKKLRDESPAGQFPIFFMYTLPNTDNSFKLISDGMIIDNSKGGFDKSVNDLITHFGDNFAELY